MCVSHALCCLLFFCFWSVSLLFLSGFFFVGSFLCLSLHRIQNKSKNIMAIYESIKKMKHEKCCVFCVAVSCVSSLQYLFYFYVSLYTVFLCSVIPFPFFIYFKTIHNTYYRLVFFFCSHFFCLSPFFKVLFLFLCFFCMVLVIYLLTHCYCNICYIACCITLSIPFIFSSILFPTESFPMC